jgi:putative Holliday junction resolvase
MASDPTLSLEDFVAAVAPGSRLIGLDLGTKTIGLALSDLGRGIATPLETIRREKFTLDAARLLGICRTHKIGGMVIGLPLNMDGTEGPRVQSTRSFTRNLAEKTDLPMTLWDERLSTAAVTRTLIEADRSRARRAELVDKMAAAYILQGFLDRLGYLQLGSTGSGPRFPIYDDGTED